MGNITIQFIKIKIRSAFTLLQLLIRQRTIGFDVNTTPLFDDDSTVWFMDKLKTSNYYLEYGSGGSTVYAAGLKKSFICIDSDPYFLDSVKRKIRKLGILDENNQTFIHADIGLTGNWGHPIALCKASAKRLEKFAQYSNLPPACRVGSFVPNLVLIDGRFRVACFLKVVMQYLGSSDITILMDDYSTRPCYWVAEDYAEKRMMIGRMAVFTPTLDVSKDKLDLAIRQYETIVD